MDDTLRARVRTQLERVLSATRALPGLGFGRARRPPTEPLQRDAPPFQRTPAPHDEPRVEDQQHVDPPRYERGHPKR